MATDVDAEARTADAVDVSRLLPRRQRPEAQAGQYDANTAGTTASTELKNRMNEHN